MASRIALRGTALHRGGPAEIALVRTSGPLTFAQRGATARLDELRPVRTDRGVTVATKDGRVRVDLVEHLLAAIGGIEIGAGLRVEVEDEVPLLDGGAARFVEALVQIGAGDAVGCERSGETNGQSIGPEDAVVGPLADARGEITCGRVGLSSGRSGAASALGPAALGVSRRLPSASAVSPRASASGPTQTRSSVVDPRRAPQHPLQPTAPRLRVARAATLTHGRSTYRFTPGEGVGLRVRVDFPAPVGEQTAAWDGSPDDFAARIAPARTFGWAHEYAALRAEGRAAGVDLATVLVFDGHGVVEGCRPPEPSEPARHKLLDLIGDLALYGGPPRGTVDADLPGHTATHAVVAQAFATSVLVL